MMRTALLIIQDKDICERSIGNFKKIKQTFDFENKNIFVAAHCDHIAQQLCACLSDVIYNMYDVLKVDDGLLPLLNEFPEVYFIENGVVSGLRRMPVLGA
tara:strand:- start:128 stop:427 length:300 start_codon:yes stop_codon:yes gene_type:complete